jgi:hypothetical protein
MVALGCSRHIEASGTTYTEALGTNMKAWSLRGAHGSCGGHGRCGRLPYERATGHRPSQCRWRSATRGTAARAGRAGVGAASEEGCIDAHVVPVGHRQRQPHQLVKGAAGGGAIAAAAALRGRGVAVATASGRRVQQQATLAWGQRHWRRSPRHPRTTTARGHQRQARGRAEGHPQEPPRLGRRSWPWRPRRRRGWGWGCRQVAAGPGARYRHHQCVRVVVCSHRQAQHRRRRRRCRRHAN